MHDLVHQCGSAIASAERPRAGEQLVEDHACAEDVGARPDHLAGQLLRRHVVRRADDGSCHRPLLLGIGDARNAEIGELDLPAVRQHHVGGLDVSMDDALLMRVVQRLQQLRDDANRFVERRALTGVENLLELAPAHELHHDVGEVVLLTEVVGRHDVRMGHAGRGMCLAQEPLRVVPRGVVRCVLADGLDRDRAVQCRIDGFVHDAHGALAEHLYQPVATQRCVRGSGHGVAPGARSRREQQSRSRYASDSARCQGCRTGASRAHFVRVLAGTRWATSSGERDEHVPDA